MPLPHILLEVLNPDVRSALRRAKEHVKAHASAVNITGGSLRACEPTQIVVAIFFERSDRPSRPNPYRLVRVDRKTGEPSFLEPGPDSAYWIRGRK